MNGEGCKVTVHAKFRLVKWEGDAPPDCEEIDPTTHPRCLEVIEGSNDPDDVPTVIYRRP